MTLKDREKEIIFSENFSKKDWEDSWRSTDKLLLLAKPEEREMYENMIINIFNSPKTSPSKKIRQISTIAISLTTKENFHRVLKHSRREFITVFDVVGASIGPQQFRILLKGAYLKFKKRAGR